MLNYYTDKKYVPDGMRIINKSITYSYCLWEWRM